MPFDDQLKIQIQESTDIVDLISEQLLLKQKGREFAGLCPFHDDKNPSMSVSPTKQIYKCFSCGAGGDVYSWMMNYHKMEFPEAMKYLAERANIEWPKDQGSAGRGQGSGDGPTERELIAEANERATQFFRQLLSHEKHGTIARQYIEKRGINAQMLEAFQIGYAPDRWDGLAMTVSDKGWSPRGFELAGLINERKNASPQTSNLKPQASNHYDRMRHRLMFPIFDALGRPIAFGGRVLPDGTLDDPSGDAKYLNSPETALFNKSQTLYGLHVAKKPIIDSRTAVIVEGYTDVIACHQAGAANVVATLGTALTAGHVKVLKRYCEKVVLLFDADAAGQKAADRAVEIFLTEEADVFIAVLPAGQDPADLMSQPGGIDQWNSLVTHAADAISYQFARVSEQMEASDTLTGRQHLAETFVGKLAALGLARQGAIRKSMIVQRLATLLHLPEDGINALLKQHAPRQRPPSARPSPSGNGGESTNNHYDSPQNLPTSTENLEKSANSALPDVASDQNGNRIKLERAERQLVGCLLRRPGLFAEATLNSGLTLDEALTPGDFVSPNGQALYQRMYDALANGEEMHLAPLLANLAEAGELELANLATQAAIEIDQMMPGNAGSTGSYKSNNAGESATAEPDGPIDAGSSETSDELLLVKLTSAAEVILGHHQTTEYLRTRTAAVQHHTEAPNDALKQVFDYHKANPSPLKIMRRD